MSPIGVSGIMAAAAEYADAVTVEMEAEVAKAELLGDLVASLYGSPNPLSKKSEMMHSESSATTAARQTEVYREAQRACIKATHTRILAEGAYAAAKAAERVS